MTKFDWLLNESKAAGQPVVLSVGMKGLGWPEFYIPLELQPQIADGGDAGQDPLLRSAVVDFVSATVSRYRDNPMLVAWQVENEPLNPAGPHRWFIGKDLLALEVDAVRAIDSRPTIVRAWATSTCSSTTPRTVPASTSRPCSASSPTPPRRQSLNLLGKGDILGLDIYTEIGYNFLGHDGVSHAGSDWATKAGHWLRVANKQGKQAWVTEAQAEPWEASINSYGDPKSTVAEDIHSRFSSIRAQGFGTILLWGSEYWLWRSDNGDTTWLDAVKGILAQNSAAPSLIVAT